MRVPGIMVMVLAIAGGAAPAEAQLREVRPGGIIGIAGTLARPVGEFQRFVSWGGGLDLYGVLQLDRDRHVGVRFEGSFIVYGHERFSVPLSPYVSRVLVDVTTDNMIFNLGAGPQITLDVAGVHPYAYGTVGLAYFATVSRLSGSSDFDDGFASSTNFDDFTPALGVGGGILVPLSRGRRPVSLDFSVQSTYHGEAEYLRRGGVVDNPDGSVTVFPIRSDANLLTFRVGVAIGV